MSPILGTREGYNGTRVVATRRHFGPREDLSRVKHFEQIWRTYTHALVLAFFPFDSPATEALHSDAPEPSCGGFDVRNAPPAPLWRRALQSVHRRTPSAKQGYVATRELAESNASTRDVSARCTSDGPWFAPCRGPSNTAIHACHPCKKRGLQIARTKRLVFVIGTIAAIMLVKVLHARLHDQSLRASLQRPLC